MIDAKKIMTDMADCFRLLSLGRSKKVKSEKVSDVVGFNLKSGDFDQSFEKLKIQVPNEEKYFYKTFEISCDLPDLTKAIDSYLNSSIDEFELVNISFCLKATESENHFQPLYIALVTIKKFDKIEIRSFDNTTEKAEKIA